MHCVADVLLFECHVYPLFFGFVVVRFLLFVGLFVLVVCHCYCCLPLLFVIAVCLFVIVVCYCCLSVCLFFLLAFVFVRLFVFSSYALAANTVYLSSTLLAHA